MTPVASFFEESEDLIRKANDFIGAVYDESGVRVERVGRTRCPRCGTVVSVQVLAGDHADGTVAGGAMVVAPCDHHDEILGWFETVEARVNDD